MKKHAQTSSNLQACSELAGKKSTVVLQDYSPIEPLQRGRILTQKLKLRGEHTTRIHLKKDSAQRVSIKQRGENLLYFRASGRIVDPSMWTVE